jgi:hypothetical protein
MAAMEQKIHRQVMAESGVFSCLLWGVGISRNLEKSGGVRLHQDSLSTSQSLETIPYSSAIRSGKDQLRYRPASNRSTLSRDFTRA